jgi:hypothetical protein
VVSLRGGRDQTDARLLVEKWRRRRDGEQALDVEEVGITIVATMPPPFARHVVVFVAIPRAAINWVVVVVHEAIEQAAKASGLAARATPLASVTIEDVQKVVHA